MKKIILLVRCVMLFPCLIWAEEIQSSIHEVDGHAYLSEDKTISEMRAEAFALAKRHALEAAKTRIQSLTRVKNMEMEYDLVQSSAEGMVTVLEQKDLGISEGRYHVWIKAKVEYVLRPLPELKADSAGSSSPTAYSPESSTNRAGQLWPGLEIREQQAQSEKIVIPDARVEIQSKLQRKLKNIVINKNLRKDGLTVLSITGDNTAYGNLVFYLKADWYDAYQTPINSLLSRWQKIFVQSKSKFHKSLISPSIKAKDFNLYLSIDK